MSKMKSYYRLISMICATVLISIWQIIPAHAQLLRDTEIEEVLYDFSEPILEAAGLKPKSVDLFIVNDPSLNAFVTRGQNIFFHTGLILESQDPNQLKGVIAHEAGHIAGGHLVRRDEGSRSATAAFLIAAGIGLAAILAGEGEAGSLILGGSQQFGALEALAYSRVNEAAADQYAAQYMARTGQSAQGLIDFFDKFRYQEVFSNARRFPYFRGHPLSSERIGALREIVAESEHPVENDTDEDKKKLRMVQAKLYGFLEAPQRVFTTYPESDYSDEAHYARSIAHFRAANLTQAIKEIDALIEREPENPYFYELKGQILFESGQGFDAIEPLQTALELKPDAPLLKVLYGQALIESPETEDVEHAVEMLKEALLLESSNASAWYFLGQAYGRLNLEGLAKYATAEQAFAVGNLQRAQSFARRAQQEISRDLPQYRRASDIVVISQANLARKGRDRYRPKP